MPELKPTDLADRYVELRLAAANKFNEAIALIVESERAHEEFVIGIRRLGHEAMANRFGNSRRERLNALVHNYADPALLSLIRCIQLDDDSTDTDSSTDRLETEGGANV